MLKGVTLKTEHDELGGRLPLVDPSDLTSRQKTLHKELMATMVPWAKQTGFQAEAAPGQLIGPFNSMLRSPQISQTVLKLVEAEREHTSLSERIRQVIILSVGHVWKADYELYAHSAAARKAGFNQATIADLRAGKESAELFPDERLAQQLTLSLVAEHKVAPELYAAGLAAFGEQGIVDLIYLAGNYMTVSALLTCFEVPAPVH